MGHHEREKTFTALVQIDKFLPNSNWRNAVDFPNSFETSRAS